MTNPKGYLFFTAFLLQFLIASELLLRQYAVHILIFLFVDVAVMSIYAGLGVRATQFLREQGVHWMDGCSGGLLMVRGGAIAFVRRAEISD